MPTEGKGQETNLVHSSRQQLAQKTAKDLLARMPLIRTAQLSMLQVSLLRSRCKYDPGNRMAASRSQGSQTHTTDANEEESSPTAAPAS
eukprot:scaffold552368_cov38-Prasinocladus_malaysianus.AAC.1